MYLCDYWYMYVYFVDLYPPFWMNWYQCTQIYMHTQPHMQEGFFPLFSASQEGHDSVVEKLLQAGATVDMQNKVENCVHPSIVV